MMDFQASWLLAADAAETATQTPDKGMAGWLLFSIVLMVLILPYVIGELVSRGLNLKNYGSRIGTVLLVFTLGLLPFVQVMIQGKPIREAFHLGIDLAGGMNLVYEVDVDKAKEQGKDVTPQVMDQMVGAMKRRVAPTGTEEVTVRKRGRYKIEIIVPKVDPTQVADTERLVEKLGSLEFAILATSRTDTALVAEARKLSEREKTIVKGGDIRAKWVPVALDVKTQKPKEMSTHGDAVTRSVTTVLEKADGTKEDIENTEFLVLFEAEEDRVTGKYLTKASPTTDPQSGTLAVSFNFNSQGGFIFRNLTSRNRPGQDGFQRRLAVLLNEEIHSAPNLRETISSSGQITGNFSQEEVDELVNVLNAGALKVPLKSNPSRDIVDPTIGIEVQSKGKLAVMIASCAVVVFMLIYYRVAGIIANIALMMNIVLVLGTMAFIDATFTLPGIAGIVLTIGMAVDANVLIFERMREELARGSSLRMAIQNGFDKAFTTIIDANLTTLITGLVLYIIGTDQVKGFAVTLIIGILMSMFTALYLSRLIFEILERKRWLKKLHFMAIVKPNSTFNFIGKKKVAAVVSAAVITVGLISFAARGKENLDIDFTGGSMVSFEFVEEQELEEVRALLKEEFGEAITVERLRVVDDKNAQKVNRFRLRTRDPDKDAVRSNVHAAFEGSDDMELRHIAMTVGEITSVVPEQEEGEEEEAEDTKTLRTVNLAFHTQNESGKEDFELPASSIADYVLTELAGMKNADDEPKYGEKAVIATFVSVEGTKGSGLKGKIGITRLYNEFELTAEGQVDEADLKTALTNVATQLDKEPFFPEIDTFDTSVAGETQQQAILALLVSLVAIVAYIWFRFERITFGFAAVAALLHDVLVVLGMVAIASWISKTPIGTIFAFEDFKINLPMIAAFLTIVGYSLNDTIVVFDRIREVRGKNPALTDEMVNRSLNQTLARTLLTSVTTFLVVLILYALGGEGIHGFAFCLVLGVIVGTYSSIYVASPVLLWLMNRPGTATARSVARKPSTT